MSQEPAPDQPAWTSLLGVPAIVARQLRTEPLLLTCFGVAVLLTILALFGPAGAALYAWLLAGLTLVLSIAWSLLRHGMQHRRADRTGTDPGTPSAPGSISAAIGDRTAVGDVDLRAANRNAFTAGRRTRIQSLTMRAGLPEPAEAGPGVAAPDRTPDGPAPEGSSDDGPSAGRR